MAFVSYICTGRLIVANHTIKILKVFSARQKCAQGNNNPEVFCGRKTVDKGNNDSCQRKRRTSRGTTLEPFLPFFISLSSEKSKFLLHCVLKTYTRVVRVLLTNRRIYNAELYSESLFTA